MDADIVPVDCITDIASSGFMASQDLNSAAFSPQDTLPRRGFLRGIVSQE
jgi:hypothetical protein